jgi:tripartite-type tricarboxylate transporter receptor subunit TctC
VPIGGTAEEFRARIAADIAKWSRIIEAAGIKPN